MKPVLKEKDIPEFFVAYLLTMNCVRIKTWQVSKMISFKTNLQYIFSKGYPMVYIYLKYKNSYCKQPKIPKPSHMVVP